MRIAFSLIALAVSVAAMPAAANPWRLAASGGELGDRSQFYVDLGTVIRDGDDVTFTTMTVYEKTDGARDFDLSVNKRRGNCATMAGNILAGRYSVAGKLLEDNTSPTTPAIYPTGSMMYDVLATVCGKSDWLGPETTSPEDQSRNLFTGTKSFGGH